MELKDALIPALVLEAKVEQDTHYVSSINGFNHEIAGRRRIKMTIELEHRNKEELDWLWQSLQENGNRISLIPDGSPIIHPATLAEKAISPIVATLARADQPKTQDSAW